MKREPNMTDIFYNKEDLMEYFGIESFFSAYQRSFPKLIRFKIRTEEFLVSSEDFVVILDKLGFIFTLPRLYMKKCVAKIKNKYEEDYANNHYLEDMLLKEQDEGKSEVAQALLSLSRLLQFFLEFFERICNDETLTENLSVFAQTAYENSLYDHHGCLLNTLYAIMIALFPKRTPLLNKLAFNKDNVEEFVLSDMYEFTINLRYCLKYLNIFYVVNEIEAI